MRSAPSGSTPAPVLEHHCIEYPALVRSKISRRAADDHPSKEF
jgi:hypothetical protein